MKTIMREDGSPMAEIEEQSSLLDIMHNCYGFFATKNGKRETYTVYRGQLIVRNTVTFGNGYGNRKTSRRTTVYLYLPKGFLPQETEPVNHRPDTFCISSGSNIQSIRDAEKLIDRVLDGGKYFYGI